MTNLRVYKSYEKAFSFYSSSGSSGKLTLLHLMHNILDQQNCALLSLGVFGRDFGCEPVLGVSVVLADETDTHGFVKRRKEFKQYVIHDVITIQRKSVKAVQQKPRGVAIQVGDKPPEFPGKTEATTKCFVFILFGCCSTGEFDPPIKSELMVDWEVQEYMLRRALELPEFVSFIEGETTMALRQQARVQNDSVLEWWLEKRGEFRTNLISWDSVFDVFDRWAARINPGMKSVMPRKKFVRHFHATAEDDSTWNPMRSRNSVLVITNYWVTNVEPLAVQYGLVEQYAPGTPLINRSPSAVAGMPHVRGSLRINLGAMLTPARPTQVVTIQPARRMGSITDFPTRRENNHV